MESLTERLRSLDCCAVSDALDALGLKPAVEGLLPLSARRLVAGRAVTVRLDSKPPDGGSKRHLGTNAVESAGPGDVIVVAHQSRDDCAGWGGVLSTGAKLKAIDGVVIDGAARDIDEAIELDFPIYGRKPIAVTARGRVYETSFNTKIDIVGVDVDPGDYVIADSSGVAFIPAARAEEVIGTAEKIARKEKLMVAELKKGLPITEVMGLDYEKMLGTQ
ncbi:MAG: RraA family protein [Gammaproteobacteria bacterium]|nr:RraA family protein [Gammaproteobacteria bacterium]MYH34796.1 RraA family protein [Gammaproteobacteria bacterium]